MASIEDYTPKIDVFQELQNLETRARKLDNVKSVEWRRERELRLLRTKLKSLEKKRDELKEKLHQGPQQLIEKVLEPGRKVGTEERKQLESILENGERKHLEELKAIYRLTGTSIDSSQKNILRLRFDTSYKGEFFEPYYVEVKSDPAAPSRQLRHSLPPFIPVEELREKYLHHNVRGFVDAVHQYLVPCVMRREEVLKMERKFDDNLEGDVMASGSYDFLSFTLVDVKYFEAPLEIRLVYDDLKDNMPERISITPLEENEMSSSMKQLLSQYKEMFSTRPLSEVVGTIVTGDINTRTN